MLKVAGLFRIEKEIEIVGLDAAEVGGIDPEVYDKIRAHSFVSRAQSSLSIYSPIKLPNAKDRFAQRNEFGSYAGINKSEQHTVGGGSVAAPLAHFEKEEDVVLMKKDLEDV
mmetsp:Transcript_36631/g.35417  ORF Transcript_36631/g.35417 Transcript_36631/m.35417 type:complete len:112 (+) Transcript_36631:1318-1653(+)